MKVEVKSILDSPVESVWRALQQVSLLQYVSAPLLSFVPIDPPVPHARWDGSKLLVKLRLFGFIPMGKQWIVPSIEREDPTPGAAQYRLRDNGSGSLAKRWDHHINISRRPDGRTDYSDTVEVAAGVLTFGVWVFAWVFYRHRQRRLRRLARQGFAGLTET